MAHPITIPKFGQTVEEATIVEWHKKEGDNVVEGDVLFEIETDKAVLEVESFFAGTLLKILVSAGQTEPVQTVVAFVGEPGEEIPKVEQPVKPAPPKPAAPKHLPKRETGVPVEPVEPVQTVASAEPAADAAPVRFKISPRAKKLAKDNVIDPTRVTGTGPGGRVIERDVAAYLEQAGYHRIKVTPTAKQVAADEQLDLLAIEGSGHDGRIVVQDVRRAAAEKPQPMSKMRRIIAERLTHSFTSTPHFYTTVAVDMTDLLAFRQKLKADGKSLTVTDFIIKAVVDALIEIPVVNSTTDGQAVKWSSHVHMGLAVALDSGLVVPAIRCAERLTLDELHDEAVRLTGKAREGTLPPDEMTGSTFTISNMGMMDVENFTAIINPGEGAILAVSSAIKTPVVRNDEIIVRSVMKMTLSADHRLIDGATAAKFLNGIKASLEHVG